MGQQFFFDKAARICFVPDCSLALAAASKMEIALLVLLSLGVQCVIGNPLSEEKRWGHAASNSGASNGNNIVLGKKEEERGGQAATNSQATNGNNIKIDPAMLKKLGKRDAEGKGWWGGQAASNSNAANKNNIQIGKKEEEEKRGKGRGKGRGRGGKAATISKVVNKNKIIIKKKE